MGKELTKKSLPLMFIVSVLVIWEMIIKIAHIPGYIMPAPSGVLFTLVNDFRNMYPHILTTLYECVIGFGLSVILALLLAVLMDLVPPVKQAVYPVLIITQTIPTIALAPLLIIWFGFGSLPKIIVVVITCFFPVVISLSEGLEAVDRDMEQHFHLMGASKMETFFHLKLPFGLIHFFSGLKIAATYSIMGAVIGEWLGGNQGLGVYMTRARSTYALDKLFAAITVIMVLSIGLVKLIEFFECICMPWKRVSAQKYRKRGGLT